MALLPKPPGARWGRGAGGATVVLTCVRIRDGCRSLTLRSRGSCRTCVRASGTEEHIGSWRSDQLAALATPFMALTEQWH